MPVRQLPRDVIGTMRLTRLDRNTSDHTSGYVLSCLDLDLFQLVYGSWLEYIGVFFYLVPEFIPKVLSS